MAPVTEKMGPVLRRHRERLDLKQEEVAVRAGITPVALHNMETGKSSSKSDTYERVAAAMGLRYQSVVAEAEEEVRMDELRRKIKEELRSQRTVGSQSTPTADQKNHCPGTD